MTFEHRYDEGQELDVVTGDGLELVVRRLGAEVIGWSWTHPTAGPLPLLWRNAEAADPESGWKNHATILFPIVGSLHDNRSQTSDGTAIRFNRGHGFARERYFQLVQAAGDGERFALRYRLDDDAETQALYPWRFRLEILYRLSADRLEQAITVTNRDERAMPFQVGWHPGFNTPFRTGAGAKADCHLDLPPGQLVRLHNDDDCFLTGEREVVAGGPDFAFTEPGLDRTYMFDLDGLVPPAERVVGLFDPDRACGVRVRFADYPHLGLWSNAEAPFLCIEPWQGMDDSVTQEPFERKFGMVLLPPGETDVRRASIEVVRGEGA